MAVAYIDLRTVGEVADRENPTGPLGGLGPLPVAHEVVPGTSYDLRDVKVGMTDEHVTKMITLLRDKQVLILKAGTGTGKSTFAPYRLMDPPPESLRDLPPGARVRQAHRPRPDHRHRAARAGGGRRRQLRRRDHVRGGRRRPRLSRSATRYRATVTTTRRAS